ncbi:uncharacterized protein [Apostichopus japonicus]|uniref:uncharacterized protein n=1 Tax=Stichopus japonicus TaxID=307972 RepID=UPI003AB321BC
MASLLWKTICYVFILTTGTLSAEAQAAWRLDENATTTVAQPTSVVTTMATTKATTMAKTTATTNAPTSPITGELTTNLQTDMTTSFVTDVIATTTFTMPMTTDAKKFGEWTVVKDGKDCMKILLGGVFQYGEGESIEIPPEASSDGSKCMGDVALFNLLLEEETSATKVFEMNLQFEMADDTYKLTRLNFTLLIDVKTYVGDRHSVFLEAPVGDYFVCDDKWTEEIASITLDITHRKFQPFVQSTKDKDYGNEFKCGDPLPGGKTKRVGLIVTLTLLAVFIVAVGLFFVLRKRSSYRRFTNNTGV